MMSSDVRVRSLLKSLLERNDLLSNRDPIGHKAIVELTRPAEPMIDLDSGRIAFDLARHPHSGCPRTSREVRCRLSPWCL